MDMAYRFKNNKQERKKEWIPFYFSYRFTSYKSNKLIRNRRVFFTEMSNRIAYFCFIFSNNTNHIEPSL